MSEAFFEPRNKKARRRPALFDELRKKSNKKFIQTKLFNPGPEVKEWDFLTY